MQSRILFFFHIFIHLTKYIDQLKGKMFLNALVHFKGFKMWGEAKRSPVIKLYPYHKDMKKKYIIVHIWKVKCMQKKKFTNLPRTVFNSIIFHLNVTKWHIKQIIMETWWLIFDRKREILRPCKGILYKQNSPINVYWNKTSFPLSKYVYLITAEFYTPVQNSWSKKVDKSIDSCHFK